MTGDYTQVSEIRELTVGETDQVSGGLIQEMMASLKLMGEVLSNVGKTRAEISMTFVRNVRG